MPFGIGMLIYLSLHQGQVDFLGTRGYRVYADFPTASGVRRGAVVELAGVTIGRVEAIEVVDSHARVWITLHHAVALREDAQAAIKAQGLIGERYIEITPGRAEKTIMPGGQIRQTEPPLDLQDLLMQFLFGAGT
jgi:phospholipid/cholesterol/gamma-HCH transport system substrate-binding protein